MEGARDPEEALRAAGLYFAYDSAAVWVSPAQLAVLTAELEAMEATLSYEVRAVSEELNTSRFVTR